MRFQRGSVESKGSCSTGRIEADPRASVYTTCGICEENSRLLLWPQKCDCLAKAFPLSHYPEPPLNLTVGQQNVCANTEKNSTTDYEILEATEGWSCEEVRWVSRVAAGDNIRIRGDSAERPGGDMISHSKLWKIAYEIRQIAQQHSSPSCRRDCSNEWAAPLYPILLEWQVKQALLTWGGCPTRGRG